MWLDRYFEKKAELAGFGGIEFEWESDAYGNVNVKPKKIRLDGNEIKRHVHAEMTEDNERLQRTAFAREYYRRHFCYLSKFADEITMTETMTGSCDMDGISEPALEQLIEDGELPAQGDDMETYEFYEQIANWACDSINSRIESLTSNLSKMAQGAIEAFYVEDMNDGDAQLIHRRQTRNYLIEVRRLGDDLFQEGEHYFDTGDDNEYFVADVEYLVEHKLYINSINVKVHTVDEDGDPIEEIADTYLCLVGFGENDRWASGTVRECVAEAIAEARNYLGANSTAQSKAA